MKRCLSVMIVATLVCFALEGSERIHVVVRERPRQERPVVRARSSEAQVSQEHPVEYWRSHIAEKYAWVDEKFVRWYEMSVRAVRKVKGEPNAWIVDVVETERPRSICIISERSWNTNAVEKLGMVRTPFPNVSGAGLSMECYQLAVPITFDLFQDLVARKVRMPREH